MTNIYQEHGFKNRKEYLLSLASDYDVQPSIVFTLANLLGESEDFDVNKFIDEHWKEIQEGSERLEKMLQEMYKEEEGIYIIYDIED